MDLEGGAFEQDEENLTDELSAEEGSHRSARITQATIPNLDTTHNYFLQNYVEEMTKEAEVDLEK